ncbi:MAG: electron transfer flavoprotein subunit alpha/FixB family protein, partial [Acidobacteria bacterium]|nr:electron transfer flavoprotein subunit alpha/FixB family protein [Acidobacteriota bacterium]
MPDEILVFTEHQGGKLVRPTWEALAAGQALAQELGASVSAVILGNSLSGLAQDLATVEVNAVLSVESPLLAGYTADGYTLALREV